MHILEKRREPQDVTGAQVDPHQPVGPPHGLNGHHGPAVRRGCGVIQASAPRDPALATIGSDTNQISADPERIRELDLGPHQRTVREPCEVRQVTQS